MVYKNLCVEMIKKDVTKGDITELLGLHRETVNTRLRGKSKFKITEMREIKERFFNDCSIDYLFFDGNYTSM